MARKLAYGLAALTVSFCSAAYGLGLGSIESQSSLNEPLTAHIALHAVEPGELDQIQVRLASSEAFARAGVERPFLLSQLQFDVDVEAGTPVIRVATREAVTEPFLSFLVEVSWPRGQMVREYTLLLDPPIFAEERRSTATAASGGRSTRSSQHGDGAAASTAIASPRAVSAREPGQRDPLPAGESYVVQAGDSLWSVAERVRPDRGVGTQQAMLALLRSNPEAFINGDPDRLRRGAVLHIPERQAMLGTSNINAAREIERLVAARGPEATRLAPADPEPQRVASSTGGATANSLLSDGRLQVVAAVDTGDGFSAGIDLEGDLPVTDESLQALQSELSLLTESNVNLEAENADLRAQVAAMREELQALQQLVTLQAAPVNVQSAAQGESERLGEGSATTAPSAEVTDVAELPGEAEETSAAAPAVVPTVLSSEPENVAEPSWMELVRDPRIAAALGGTALVIGLWALLINRRRRLARAVPATIHIDAEHEQPTLDETETSSSATPVDEFDSGRDPLAEADAFLAYGRYDQAQATVLDALEAEPERVDLRLKLLEVFALTENRVGFEEHAEVLHEQVGGTGLEWDRAVEMGREIAPEHPFFSVDEPSVSAPIIETVEATLPEFPENDESMTLGDTFADEPPLTQQDDAEEADDDTYLDFSLDFDPEATATQPVEAESDASDFDVPADDDMTLDFEVGFAAEDQPATEEIEPSLPSADETVAASADLDFDLEALLEQAETPEVAPSGGVTTDLLESDLDDKLDFSFDEFGDSSLSTDTTEAGPELDDFDAPVDPEQEIGTKLDLARAYLEMGDEEGARELLSEVIEEGSDAQKQTASQMLKQAS